MPTIHPKEPKDLLLAPVAVEVDRNVAYLREQPSPEELEFAVQLRLNGPAGDDSRAARQERVLRIALDGVEMHGWEAAVTDDGSSIRLAGGSASVDIGLGARLSAYVTG